jgi:hypothetical protein
MSYVVRFHDVENGKDIYCYYVSCNDGYGMEEWSTPNIGEANRYDSEEGAKGAITSLAEWVQGEEPLEETIGKVEAVPV